MRACEVEFAPFALRAQACGVVGEVEGLAVLSCKDGGGVGCGPGHVQVSYLLGCRAAGEVAEGEELRCSWCSHDGCVSGRTRLVLSVLALVNGLSTVGYTNVQSGLKSYSM